MTTNLDNPLPGRLAAKAESIVKTLQHTDYQHTERIDVANGIYDCDCSGFVGYVLKEEGTEHYALLPKETTQPRPRAFEYYKFFISLTPQSIGGWVRVDTLAEARRGDIIAWRFPTVAPGKDTGHVLFVAETPRLNASGSFFIVRVCDSANGPHFEDTRGTGPGQFATGIGSGLLNFKVDAEGRPISFQFSPTDVFTTFPIAIGRVEPLPVNA